MTPRFIAATRQLWKLIPPLVVVTLAGSVILFQDLVPHVDARTRVGLLVSATFLGLAAFAVPCLLLRCPRCRARLFWQAVRTQRSSGWLAWLLSLTCCPSCSYAPADERDS